jgi:hypothetical protein
MVNSEELIGTTEISDVIDEVSYKPPTCSLATISTEPYRRPQEEQCLTTGLVNISCAAGKSGKIWSACRQHEIEYTK